MGGADDDLGGSSQADDDGTARVHQWGPETSDIGLRVTFPGIKLGSIPEGVGSAQDHKFVVLDKKKKSKRYSVQLVPDEAGEYPAWKSGFNYVLVLARKLSAPHVLGCVAVLGRQLLPVGQLRHECLAWVELQSEPKTFGKHMVTGVFTRDKTSWIIV
jgi:hypothetical protein